MTENTETDTLAPTIAADQDTPTVAAPAPSGCASALTIGSVVKDRFVLEQLIGKGGMGVIFKTLDRRKQEARDRAPYVAMKVLGESFKNHPDALISLQREAKKAQLLAHPNIVTVYDFDRDGECVYMTMEWLDGEPLDQLLRRKRSDGIPPEQAFSLIDGMGQGLAYAHKRDIVHSDFKPGNVFVTRSGEAKILDFGIARAAARPKQAADATVFDPGKLGALTPAYASCEMLERADPDPRDDIFALACVAYELLSGRHPFDHKMATIARAAKLSPTPIPCLNHRQWQALLKGLSYERDARTATVEEFLADLSGRPVDSANVRKWIAISLVTATIGIAAAATLWFLRPIPEAEQITVTRMELPPPPTPKSLEAEERERLEERLMVAEVQLEQGRGFDPWYLYDAHGAYLDAMSIDPVNATARQGLLEAARAMRKNSERNPAFATWSRWLEAISSSLEIPLIASTEADVKELNALADEARSGMIAAIRTLADEARASGDTDSWDKAWLAIRQGLQMPLVTRSADDLSSLQKLQGQVAKYVSPELRPPDR